MTAFLEGAAETLPPDLLGWAALITAVGTPLVVVVLAVVNKTAKKVAEIDRAVNGQPPGTKTMVDQVGDLHAQIPLDADTLEAAALLPLVRRLVVLAEAEAAHKPPPPEPPA